MKSRQFPGNPTRERGIGTQRQFPGNPTRQRGIRPQRQISRVKYPG